MSLHVLSRTERDETLGLLVQLLHEQALHACFQPIVDLRQGRVLGFEGLIRGPQGSVLATPLALFEVASRHGLLLQLEACCRKVILRAFAEQGLPGQLFLNTSADCFFSPGFSSEQLQQQLAELDMRPSQLVLELTEERPVASLTQLLRSLDPYRQAGFALALDDLGAGYSSLRRWHELKPAYVKMDMHFVQEIDAEPMKRHFTQTIQQLCTLSGALLIAEGIESHRELRVLQELGVSYGQGYFLGKPQPEAVTPLDQDVVATIQSEARRAHQQRNARPGQVVAHSLLHRVEPVAPDVHCEAVYQRFAREPDLVALPVVDHGRPLGMLDRQTLLELFAGPFKRDLYGRRPCRVLMDADALVVEANTALTHLSQQVLEGGRAQLGKGFVITDGGLYQGVGSAFDLMRAITAQQLTAARYANPLTQLPGNVPIDEQVDRLLAEATPFVACYADLDHFKPFNDLYGYRQGDDLIRLTGRILVDACHAELDFIGHIGGDDFMLLMRSADWESRCRHALFRFDEEAANLFDPEHRRQGRLHATDRTGQEGQFPLTSLSLGAVVVSGQGSMTHHALAEQAALMKKRAKQCPGSTLAVVEPGQEPVILVVTRGPAGQPVSGC